MRNRGIVVMLLLILVMLASTACSKVSLGDDREEIHFQVLLPKSGQPNPIEQMYVKAVDHFMDENRDIRVVIDYLPQGASRVTGNDMIELLESVDAPDVVPIPTSMLPLAKERGLLLDLNPFAASGNSKLDITKEILQIATVEGELLALPSSAFPSAVLYNKKLFNQENIPYPEGEWTWEQFRELSAQFNQALGSVLPYDFSTLDMLVAGKGRSLLSPDGSTSIGYLNSEEAIEAVEWMNEYYLEDERRSNTMNVMDTAALFDSHGTAMIVGNVSFWLQNFDGENKGNLGVAPLPSPGNGTKANPMFVNGYGISSVSKHPDGAWRLINFLYNSVNEDALGIAQKTIITSQSLAEASGQLTDPLTKTYFDELSYSVKASNDLNPFFVEAWNGQLAQEFQKLLSTSSSDLPAAMYKLAVQMDAELKRLETEE